MSTKSQRKKRRGGRLVETIAAQKRFLTATEKWVVISYDQRDSNLSPISVIGDFDSKDLANDWILTRGSTGFQYMPKVMLTLEDADRKALIDSLTALGDIGTAAITPRTCSVPTSHG